MINIATDVLLPDGLPIWLVTFIREAERENQTLIENGAAQQATARGSLLHRLIDAAEAHLNSELNVEQAASLLGKHPETIRRAVRKGALPDGRSNPRGNHRIRRRDLEALAGHSSARYDPDTDAQDIASRKRPL